MTTDDALEPLAGADLTPTRSPAVRPDDWLQKRRRKLALGAVLAVLVAVGLYVWLRPSRAARDTLLSLPKGLMMAASIDIQRLLNDELLAAPLGTTEGQAGIEQARNRFGLDPRELEVLAMGLDVTGGEIGLIAILRGRYDVPKLRAALAEIPDSEATTLGSEPATLMRFGVPLAEAMPALAYFAEGDDQQATLAALPILPDLVFAVRDDRTLVVGTRRLLDAWLAGTSQLGDDGALADLVEGETSAGALGVGVAQWEGDGEGIRLFTTLQGLVMPKMSLPAESAWPSMEGVFDFEIEGRKLDGRGLYRMRSEADAEAMEERLIRSNEASRAMTGGLVKQTVRRDGSDVRITMGFTIPGP